MTIREHLEQLAHDFASKTDAYIKAQEKLMRQGNGIFESVLVDNLAEAKTAWQQSANAYNAILSLVVNNRLNVDAEM